MAEFTHEPDLTNPIELHAEMVDLEQAMLRQSEASGSRGAALGHPYPEYFFGRVARALAAGATVVKAQIPPAPPPETPPESSPAAPFKTEAPKTGKK